MRNIVNHKKDGCNEAKPEGRPMKLTLILKKNDKWIKAKKKKTKSPRRPTLPIKIKRKVNKRVPGHVFVQGLSLIFFLFILFISDFYNSFLYIASQV